MNAHFLFDAEQFRDAVFKRDRHSCVICSAPAVDAHYILASQLWDDGGHYLENGVSLCRKHQLECNMTHLSPKQVRDAARIQQVVLPGHFQEANYDHWGNEILTNGRRLRGELFVDDEVQEILSKGLVLDQFTWQVKYPRTIHLPWSEGVGSDDRTLRDVLHFIGRRVVVTVKMDGENTSLYSDFFHARSLDSRHHPSRDWIKNFWGRIKHEIPVGWRICGENLFARHSITYEDLVSFFTGFSLWNERNRCFSWQDTIGYFDILDIEPVEEIYCGIFDQKLIHEAYLKKSKGRICEGYVVRLEEEFDYRDFRKSVAKFVRKNHVTTDQHWMAKEVVPNKLKM